MEIKAEIQIIQTALVDPERLIETMLRLGWHYMPGPRDPVVTLRLGEAEQVSVPRSASVPNAERLLTVALCTVTRCAGLPVRVLLLEVMSSTPVNFSDPLTTAARAAVGARFDPQPPGTLSALIEGVLFAHLERELVSILERERSARFVEATAARLEKLRCFTEDERYLLRDCVDEIRRAAALVRRRSVREEVLVLDEIAEVATAVTSAAWGVAPEPWNDKTDTGWREQWRVKVRGWLQDKTLPADTRDAAAAEAVRWVARALGYKPAASPPA